MSEVIMISGDDSAEATETRSLSEMIEEVRELWEKQFKLYHEMDEVASTCSLNEGLDELLSVVTLEIEEVDLKIRKLNCKIDELYFAIDILK